MKFKQELKELREKEAEDLAQILAQRYKIPYLDLSRITINLDALKIVPEQTARERGLAVFQAVGKNLQVAVKNPNLDSTKEVLEDLKRKNYKIQLFIVSENSLKKAWDRYKEIAEFIETTKGLVNISSDKIENFIRSIRHLDDFQSALSSVLLTKQARKISEVLEIILGAALSLEASDIHIEPQEKQIRLRLRLDGVLQDVLSFDRHTYQLLLSRIKLVSELKLNVHDRAQDGRFTIRAQKMDIEVRTSILPGPYGESIVLRVLNPKTIALAFEDLGMHPYLQKMMIKEIKKPNGMILTTGPTGSGKTTTLYAFLKKIYSAEIKIITIEDPIEYHLKGISQTQVDPEKGYSFANGLKAIVRQDPDIIMVGEIRDLETAEIAIHAALTGHLVLSTLHTNTAAGTIPRLLDLGIKPNVFAPAINVAMAQRLVRKLCTKCKKQYTPNQKEQLKIKHLINNLPKGIKKPKLDKIKIWQANKCPECNNTGYKGRIGIFEAFNVNEKIERLIFQYPSETQIEKAALEAGMLTMQQDGILKVLNGLTSLKELERVVGVISAST